MNAKPMLALVLVAAVVTGAYAPAHAQTSQARALAQETLDVSQEIPLLSFGEIAEEGGEVVIEMPADRPQPFDFDLDLPYTTYSALGANPNASLTITPLLPITGTLTGPTLLYADFIVQDDPSAATVDGRVSLYFSNVPYSPGAAYTLWMSWEPDNPRTFDPTDLTGFVTLPVLSDPTSGPGGASVGNKLPNPNPNPGYYTVQVSLGRVTLEETENGRKTPCQTYAGWNMPHMENYVSDSTAGGNIYKMLAETNFVFSVTWVGQCYRAGPPAYGAGTGYASHVRGPNEAPRGGPFTIEVAFAHMGGGEGKASYDGFGWKEIRTQPSITLDKPLAGNVRLEDSKVLGYNKNSCTAWPQTLADALAFVPTNYAWSLVLHFATREYCKANWKSLDEGPWGDRGTAGFKVQKYSMVNQYEEGGRIYAYADVEGTYRMDFTFGHRVYGSVTADGNPPAGIDFPAKLTLAGAQAKVV